MASQSQTEIRRSADVASGSEIIEQSEIALKTSEPLLGTSAYAPAALPRCAGSNSNSSRSTRVTGLVVCEHTGATETTMPKDNCAFTDLVHLHTPTHTAFAASERIARRMGNLSKSCSFHSVVWHRSSSLSPTN